MNSLKSHSAWIDFSKLAASLEEMSLTDTEYTAEKCISSFFRVINSPVLYTPTHPRP